MQYSIKRYRHEHGQDNTGWISDIQGEVNQMAVKGWAFCRMVFQDDDNCLVIMQREHYVGSVSRRVWLQDDEVFEIDPSANKNA